MFFLFFFFAPLNERLHFSRSLIFLPLPPPTPLCHRLFSPPIMSPRIALLLYLAALCASPGPAVEVSAAPPTERPAQPPQQAFLGPSQPLLPGRVAVPSAATAAASARFAPYESNVETYMVRRRGRRPGRGGGGGGGGGGAVVAKSAAAAPSSTPAAPAAATPAAEAASSPSPPPAPSVIFLPPAPPSAASRSSRKLLQNTRLQSSLRIASDLTGPISPTTGSALGELRSRFFFPLFFFLEFFSFFEKKKKKKKKKENPKTRSHPENARSQKTTHRLPNLSRRLGRRRRPRAAQPGQAPRPRRGRGLHRLRRLDRGRRPSQDADAGPQRRRGDAQQPGVDVQDVLPLVAGAEERVKGRGGVWEDLGGYGGGGGERRCWRRQQRRRRSRGVFALFVCSL